MTRFKTLLLSTMVTGAMLLGNGCVPVNIGRIFNIWDFGIALIAAFAGVDLIGGIVGT